MLRLKKSRRLYADDLLTILMLRFLRRSMAAPTIRAEPMISAIIDKYPGPPWNSSKV